MSRKLTPTQLEALEMLRAGPAETSAHSHLELRWISGTCAAALRRRGLVKESLQGGATFVRLTDAGRTVIARHEIQTLYERLGRLPARISRTPAQHERVREIHDRLAEMEDEEVAMIEEGILGTLPLPIEELEAGMERAQELLARYADEDPAPEKPRSDS